jgi:WD40 repeat protein
VGKEYPPGMTLVRTLQPHTTQFRMMRIAWSPDGQTLASSSGRDTVLSNPGTGEVLHRLERKENYVTCVEFDPAGGIVACGGADSVTLWDVASGTFLRALKGHRGSISGISWSKDGRWFAAC